MKPGIAVQHLLPKQGITRLAGAFAGSRSGAATQAAIRRFIAHYGVDMSEAAEPDPAAYKSFNDFFTRALKPGARPLARADLLSPVDGAISQFGAVDGERIFQAKGHHYTARELVGGDAALAAHFHAGHFATLYLAPKDYHRIHMPCSGRLLRMIHVPGALFSVNPATAMGVPGLFARNERVVCVFDGVAGPAADPAPPRGRAASAGGGAGQAGARGPWILVLVGATIVGSMATVWHGVVNAQRSGQLREWSYTDRQLVLRQGDEMGRFLLGSTVVMLFPPGRLEWNPAWAPGAPVRMGELMARR